MSDVVRTRLYVTHIAEWEQIGRAHGEFFGKIRPTTAMIEVNRLVSPDMLIEIEAEAVIGAKASSQGMTSEADKAKPAKPKARGKRR